MRLGLDAAILFLKAGDGGAGGTGVIASGTVPEDFELASLAVLLRKNFDIVTTISHSTEGLCCYKRKMQEMRTKERRQAAVYLTSGRSGRGQFLAAWEH